MYARVIEWDGVTTSEIDRDLAYARNEIVPRAEDIPGMSGMLVLVDRETGRSTTGITLSPIASRWTTAVRPPRLCASSWSSIWTFAGRRPYVSSRSGWRP